MNAVLFDLDGTLVSTRPEYRYSVVGRTLHVLGTTARAEHVDLFWFEAHRDEIIAQTFGVEPAIFWTTYKQFDLSCERVKSTVAYADIGTVAALRDLGLKVGLVTNAPKHIADIEIDLIGRHLFDSVVWADPARGIQPKPSPDGIRICLDELELEPRNAIFVGNSTEDIQAANAAGVFDVHIDRKEYAYPAQERVPSYCIGTLHELLTFVEKYWHRDKAN